jgi:prepilin-type N-terminal cleavage/methylation domain-containing protein
MMVRKGFSLVELLIALALSSVIMLGLVQANRNAARLLQEAQSLLVVNRQVALLYNQLERDITGCTQYEKPVPYVKEQPKKKEEGVQQAEPEKPEPEKPPEEKTDKKKEKEPFISCCTLEPFEDSAYRVGDKKWQQTKKVSFITTTPLEVYDQGHERMVRVGYELVYDKKLSSPQKSVHILYRLQTDELENATFKEDEQKKTKPVSKVVVANRVKQFSLEAAYDKRPRPSSEATAGRPLQKKEGGEAEVQSDEPQEQIKTFTWGEEQEKEKSKTVFPDHFSAHIELWDVDLNRSYSFVCTLPVFVKVDAKKDEKKAAGNQAAATPDGTTPAAPEGASVVAPAAAPGAAETSVGAAQGGEHEI